jgi:SHS2 domain-containing protein
MMRYEPFEHTADIGVRVFGRTYEEIFANAAYALFDHLTDLGAVEEKVPVSISLQGQDSEDLLVRWLNELLYLYESQGFLLKGVSFSHLDERSLVAEGRGEGFDPSRHLRKMEIKAVTYHQVQVRKADGIWEARVIFDV